MRKQIDNYDDFYAHLKEVMKNKNTKMIRLSEFRDINAKTSHLARLSQFMEKQIKYDSSDDVVMNEMSRWLNERKDKTDLFRIDKGQVTYISRFSNILSEKTLLEEVEKRPQGLLIDDEILKFTYSEIREDIKALVNKRKVMPVRSKQIEKQRQKDENYNGYYLFPYPPEVKEIVPIIYKNVDEAALEKQEMKGRIEKKFETKTSMFRPMYEMVCAENSNKGKNEARQSSSFGDDSKYRYYLDKEQTNRASIPNFDEIVKERLKNLK